MSPGQLFSLHHPQLLSCEWLKISFPRQSGLFLPATLNYFPQFLWLVWMRDVCCRMELCGQVIVLFVTARRELLWSGGVCLPWFMAAIVADCSVSEGCITGVAAEVIMRCSHEALEHFNCFICPPKCPVTAENRVDKKEKLLTARKVTVILKGLNLAPHRHFCLCKQLRFYFLRRSNFFRKRSRKWWRLYILFADCYFDLPRHWPTQVFAPICLYKSVEYYH